MNIKPPTDIEREAELAAANRARKIAYFVKRIALEQRLGKTYRLPKNDRHLFPDIRERLS